MASHKYIERKWKNGRWEYKYRTDEKSSDQLRRDTEQEKMFRARMVNQAGHNRRQEERKDPNSKAAKRANAAFDRQYDLYAKRIVSNNTTSAILDPDEHQDQLRGAYKNQSLGTKIKSDARAFKDTVSKAISDKKAHNLMLKQNKKAAKNAAKAQKEAPKIAEKIAKSNKKMSEISPKTTKTGEDFLTKLLVSDYQRFLLGDKKSKK